MYGQMTAGSWIYIGSQGIVQGTYECFAEIARRRFGGSLAGTITLTAGLGGMGGAQPLAVTMNDGVALCIEVDPERIERRLETRYLDEQRRRPRRRDRALRGGQARAPRAQRRPLRERRRGRARAAAARLRGRHRHRPDQRPRPARRLRPGRARARRGRRAARARPRRVRRARPRLGRRALLRDGRLQGRGRRGLRLRQQPARARPSSAASSAPSTTPASSPPTSGRCSARARGRSAGSRSPATRPTSPPPTAPCSRSSPTTRRSRAGSGWPASGSPSRACRRGSAGSATASAAGSGCASTRWSRSGELSAPIVIGRDHLDSGSVASPYRETEAMLDGSDAIADWPLLNALVNTASGRLLGQHPPRRRGRDRALDPRRHGLRRRRHRARRRRSSTGC